jgi:small ubiquitin-related modifier
MSGVAAKAEAKTTTHLNLKVKAQDGTEIFFKVKPTTKFGKLMDAYCGRVGVDATSVRFLFDGERLTREQTPGELDMEDEDEIDAMIQQVGGC